MIPFRAIQRKATAPNDQRGSKAPHPVYGKLGAASRCRRIDPKTGRVLEELPSKKAHKRKAKA
jgi:hypothetical protein